jgi:hypothetical protein
MIKRADVFGDASSHRKQLVIFGDEMDLERWAFYRYKDDSWEHV